jgi:hypothetical protein
MITLRCQAVKLLQALGLRFTDRLAVCQVGAKHPRLLESTAAEGNGHCEQPE